MVATYGGKATTDEAVKSGEEVVVGNTTTDFSENSKEQEEYTKEAEEAENEGKEVEVGKDEETFIIEEPATTEEKEESSNTEGSVLDDDKLSQMLPEKIEDNKENTTETEDIKEDATETEDIKEDATETEDIKEDTAETEDIKEDTAVVEDNKVEKLTVTALDGNETIVNSTVQYKVTGENVVFNGLEGYNYSFSNGILSIETGSEATILTVEAVDATGAILFDININGIVG